jgi:PAS domain S-box-containing protein
VNGHGFAPARTSSIVGRMGQSSTDSASLSQGGSQCMTRHFNIGAAQVQALIDTMPTGIVIAEAPSGVIVRGNAEMERILGHKITPNLVAERNWAVFHPDGRPLEPQESPLSRAVAGIATARMALQLRRADGSFISIRIDGAPIRDAAGQPVFGIIVVADISAERAAQTLLEQTVATRTAALRRSRTRIRALFEHSPIDIMVLQVAPGGEVTIEESNAAFCRTTGLAQLAGQRIEAALDAETGAILAADCRTCVASGGFECQHTLLFPVGERTVRTYYRALPDEELGVRRVLLTQIDLTESRRVEAALRQAMRLEAIGQLTGGVAHDFNNLLTAILGSLELLGRRVTDERQQRWVQTATSAAQRGAMLTQQLLSYARKQFLAPRATDIPATIDAMGELLRGSLGGLVGVSTDFAAGTWHALADVAQLELVLLNLVVNARDAMRMGGRLALSTRNLSHGDPYQPAELEQGDYVLLSVADTGAGMAPDVLARAMEPFFTTKGVGEGSGLGLSQAYGFARQLGGTVRLRSQPGAGTTVEVFLRRADGRERTVAPRLLLVDDDADVRGVAATLLREEGFLVDEAESGLAALALLAAGPYDAMLADLGMPGMSGIELAGIVEQRHPALPVIFLTGNADPALVGRLNGPVLNKPYSIEALLNTVGKVVRPPSPPAGGHAG